MRKPLLFAYAKTKTQISFAVTAKLISAFVFAIRKVQSLYFLYSLQDTNIVTTGGTYMIGKYVSIIVVKFTMGEQQKIYNDI